MLRNSVSPVARRLALAVAAAALFAAVPAAPAAPIYAEDFNTAGTADLAGTTPDTRTGTFGSSAAATWTSSIRFNVDGSAEAGSQGSATLPFTPVAGQVYTVSADINTTAGGQDWISLGFAQNNDVNQPFNSGNNGYAHMLLRFDRGAGQGQRFLGPSTGGGGNFDTSAGLTNYKVVLDTRPANWTAAWFVNNVQVTPTATYGTNPTINFVGFSKNTNSVGTVDNFTLDAVPEPTTAGLLTIAAAGLLTHRRRRA